ncbi:60S acidic ribosomal protein P0 [Cajanus cajan]|nr:60S acidic ribosomal protein P0 [Cajanus cajan]
MNSALSNFIFYLASVTCSPNANSPSIEEVKETAPFWSSTLPCKTLSSVHQHHQQWPPNLPKQRRRFSLKVLNIPTKIHKGIMEIITPVELIKKGDKVGSSEAALLAKLGIRPFSYGLVVLSVYDNGSVFSPEVLDLTEDDLIEKFAVGVSMVSLAISFPTLAAAPHMFVNAYKKVKTWDV